MNDNMSHLDREIFELAHQLDDVQFRAVLATAAAMANGMENVAALTLGNIVLAAAGYPPAPVHAFLLRKNLGTPDNMTR